MWRGSVEAKSERITLGKYPALELRDARKSARAVTEDRDNGVSRVDLKLRHNKSNRTPLPIPMAEPVRDDLDHLFECYMAMDGDALRTAKVRRQTYAREIQPWLGNLAVSTITKKDIRALVNRKAQAHPVGANRLFALIRRIFNWLLEQDHVEANPCAGITPPGGKEVARERALSPSEICLLRKALHTENDPWRSAVWLLLLSGERRDEVFGMSWSELDLERSRPLWTIPGSRTKNGKTHLVPLSRAMVRVINGITKHVGTDLLFPAMQWVREPGSEVAVRMPSAERSASGYSRVQARLRQKMDKLACSENHIPSIEHWSFHDMRRTMVTGLNSLGTEFRVVEATVNHVSGAGQAGVAGVYDVYGRFSEKRKALEAWSILVEEILEGKVTRFGEYDDDDLELTSSEAISQPVLTATSTSQSASLRRAA